MTHDEAASVRKRRGELLAKADALHQQVRAIWADEKVIQDELDRLPMIDLSRPQEGTNP